MAGSEDKLPATGQLLEEACEPYWYRRERSAPMIRVASMVRVLSYRTPRLPIIRFEVALEGMDVPNQRDHPFRPRHARSEWRLDLSDVVAFGILGARCKGPNTPSSVDRNRAIPKRASPQRISYTSWASRIKKERRAPALAEALEMNMV